MKTKAKKLLSILLAIVLVFGMLPVTSFAEEATEPAQIEGVYQIGTADELIWFAGNADPASKAVLTADINLAGKTWTPMAKLTGSFDGQGHTVKNLNGSNGLFTAVYGTSNTARAEVKNVTVEGTVSGGMKIAGIAGSAYWANFTGCINKANVTGSAQYVAGIVGYSLQGSNGSYITLTDCGNEGNITGSTGNVAGLVAGLALKDVYLIGRAMVDSVVEPHRKHFIPGFDALREKALEAGAIAVNISGAGPSVFAVSSDMETASRVGEVMSSHFADIGIGSDLYVGTVSNQGCRVLNSTISSR